MNKLQRYIPINSSKEKELREDLFNEFLKKTRSELPFTLSPSDLIELLPFGKTKIYELLNRNIIPSKKIEGKWIIPRDKFLTWFYSEFQNNDG